MVVDCEAGKIYVWHGCKASEYHRKAAVRAANYMKDRLAELFTVEKIGLILGIWSGAIYIMSLKSVLKIAIIITTFVQSMCKIYKFVNNFGV